MIQIKKQIKQYVDKIIKIEDKKPREQFIERLNLIKKDLEKKVNFYPYSTLGNLPHIDYLLQELNLSAEEVLSFKTINDIGGADGDIAFYCEFLGAEKVNLIDHAPTNFNNLKAAILLKQALKSNVNIKDANLDSYEGWESVEKADLTIFLGILYHLQNPYYGLLQLSKKSKYVLLSTRVFDQINEKDVSTSGLAYFYNPAECNNDATNWWCFTDECLKRLVNRSGWEIIVYKRFGCSEDADPVDNRKDGRAFAYLKNKNI